jgi:hypothetical protein
VQQAFQPGWFRWHPQRAADDFNLLPIFLLILVRGISVFDLPPGIVGRGRHDADVVPCRRKVRRHFARVFPDAGQLGVEVNAVYEDVHKKRNLN